MVVIGLGNPGARFEGTRHNVGFAAVDRIAAHLGARWRKPAFRPFAVARSGSVRLYKPLTFMNRSGEALASILRDAHASLADVVVVCDTLDLPPGTCRLRMRGSSGGQKGLESIIRSAGTEEIARLVIGVGRPPVREDVVAYVLDRPRGEEARALEEAVARAADALLRLPDEGPERVMNEINRTVPEKG